MTAMLIKIARTIQVILLIVSIVGVPISILYEQLRACLSYTLNRGTIIVG